jgi:cell wall-associated NlpC family hydrolase
MVKEARSWVGTPYVLGGRVKKAGCDCASFIAEVLIACGLADREELGVYSHDWFAHTNQEKYMLRLLRHAERTLDTVAFRSVNAHPGDILLTRTHHSRVFNHGAIVTSYPFAVHAIAPSVEEIDVSTHPLWSARQMTIFSPIGSAQLTHARQSTE